MKRILHLVRRLGHFLKDLFYTTDNESADLARILAFGAVVAEFVGEYHNIRLKQPLDLGPTGLGGGLAAILGAAAGFIAAKAWSKKKNRESEAVAQNTAIAVKNETPVVEVAPPVPPLSGADATPVTVVNAPDNPVPVDDKP